MLSLLKRLLGLGPSVDFKQLMANGAVVVDVRTPEEYRSGHLSGAINIPLDRLQGQLTTLKKKNVPVIAVCRSGARSQAAVEILQKNGVEAYNGGAWTSLRAKVA